MPRAYDQIVNVLNKLNTVRENIEVLNSTLKQVSLSHHRSTTLAELSTQTAGAVDATPTRTRVEQEERHIKDLQARVAELSKKVRVLNHAAERLSHSGYRKKTHQNRRDQN